ncbi:MAG: MerR family transcriptional regulator, partial [Alphaproteobacteria bacterium]
MKMKELEARTGVGREAIRYYIREGLLPEPERPKRNVARYGDEHVIRIKAIKRLQEERYLPLAVIKALLNSDEAIPEAQQSAFPHLDRLLMARIDAGAPADMVSLDSLIAETGISQEQVADLERIGMIRVSDGMLNPRDAAIARTCAELEAVGFDRAHGFNPDTGKFYAEFIDWLTSQEIRLFFHNLADKMDEPEAVLAAERGV